MASLVPENLACINSDDELKAIEALGINGDLLMSLLEESQGEEHNDERLNSVIQSLEAEINSNTMDDQEVSDVEDSQSSNVRYMDGHDHSVSFDLDFGWVDMEMVPSSPSDDINWYMDPCGNEMDAIIEFEGVRDYSQIYYGVPLEEHKFSSLWHETYDTEMYN